MELSEEQKTQRREDRLRRARQLAAVVPEALQGGPMPHQVLVGFALMIESLLAEEDET